MTKQKEKEKKYKNKKFDDESRQIKWQQVRYVLKILARREREIDRKREREREREAREKG